MDDDKIPVGYQKMACHCIFDVKITLTRMCRLVAKGNTVEPSGDPTFASVVSRESVRIAFLTAALNDLNILSADVQNAYINAPVGNDKIYIIAGKEFGATLAGRPAIIVRALYGLRGSGARWRDHMAATLRDAGYISCKADPDVWMRADTKADGFQYWSYVLVYSDDLLVVHHDPQCVMTFLASRYTLKKGSVKEPDLYLGAQVKKWYIAGSDDPGKVRWALSSEDYVKQAVADVEAELSNVDKCLPTKTTTPMLQGYRPELDSSAECDSVRGNYYQSLIGVLRWICELGRLDIMVAVLMLSRYVVSPRVGHLEQVFHVLCIFETRVDHGF